MSIDVSPVNYSDSDSEREIKLKIGQLSSHVQAYISDAEMKFFLE